MSEKSQTVTDAREDIQVSLNAMRQQLSALIKFYRQDLDYQRMVYDLWNAKDILGHLTFWHESFARNISDLGKGITPRPLKGKLSEVNRQSVESTASSSIDTLITRLTRAQETIEEHIFNDRILLIPYKRGSRDYCRLEHLDIVSAHIKRHLKDLNNTFHSHGPTKNQRRTANAR